MYGSLKICSRSYHKNYLNFGFTCTGSSDKPFPICIVCNENLNNESNVPSKLKRHFTIKRKDKSTLFKLSRENYIIHKDGTLKLDFEEF